MTKSLLSIHNLYVSIDSRQILRDISLSVGPGETHVLMGPNGAGKSTLGSTLMGHPKCSVDRGSITFNGEELTQLSPDERARLGLFLSFQSPVEIPGIPVDRFIRNAIHAVRGERVRLLSHRKRLEAMMKLLQMDASYGERELNVGFSGGERKKAEILQMLMLQPKLAILDETDSGLDVDAARTVSKGIVEYQRQQKGALLIITHSTRILEHLHVDRTHVIVKGQLVKSGDASLIDRINAAGFEDFEKEATP